MKNKFFPVLVFGFFCFASFMAAGSNKIDSLKSLVATNTDAATLSFLTEQIAREYFSLNLDSALVYGSRSVGYARNASDNSLLANALAVLVNIYIEKQQYDAAEALFDEAYEVCAELDDPRTWAVMYNYRGNYHYYQGQSDLAIEMYYKSMDYDVQLGDAELSMKSTGNLAIVLTNAGKKAEAIQAYHKALHTARKLQDIQSEMRLLVSLGALYSNSSPPYLNLDSAISLYEKALLIARGLDFDYGIARISGGLASPLIRAGRAKEGLESARIARLYFEEHDIKNEFFMARLNEGFALEALGKTGEAIQIAQALLQAQDFKLNQEAHRLLYMSHKREGRSGLALQHFEKYKQLTDSIADANRERALAELQTRYETERKQREIEQLSQNSKIRELQLRQQKIYLAGITTLLFLIVFLGLIFYRQNRRNQKEAIVKIEQKALRSQLNPHFIFNALGAIQNYMLRSKPEEAGNYMSRFAKLMRQILENSREDYITLDDEVKTLENYLELQLLRFDGKFSYQIVIDPELDRDGVKIPPMFAQPFIENALEHGLQPGSDGGHIIISFTRKNEQVLLTVEDNGSGLEHSSPIHRDHKSLATVITKERLSLLNKGLKKKTMLTFEDLSASLTGARQRGTRVMLSLPLKS